MDSFGLETDIKLRSKRNSILFLDFIGYKVLESDPLLQIDLDPLEIANRKTLARDITNKIRQRKGLSLI